VSVTGVIRGWHDAGLVLQVKIALKIGVDVFVEVG